MLPVNEGNCELIEATEDKQPNTIGVIEEEEIEVEEVRDERTPIPGTQESEPPSPVDLLEQVINADGSVEVQDEVEADEEDLLEVIASTNTYTLPESQIPNLCGQQVGFRPRFLSSESEIPNLCGEQLGFQGRVVYSECFVPNLCGQEFKALEPAGAGADNEELKIEPQNEPIDASFEEFQEEVTMELDQFGDDFGAKAILSSVESHETTCFAIISKESDKKLLTLILYGEKQSNYFQGQSGYSMKGVMDLTDSHLYYFSHESRSLTIKRCGLISACVYAPFLRSLDLAENKISKLRLFECDTLQELRVQRNRLDTLDLRNLEHLAVVQGYCNNIEQLNAERLDNLQEIDLSNNQMEQLDLSGCAHLRTLRCYNNQIDRLDVSLCKQLVSLEANDNNLSTVDLESCASLEVLYLHNNMLKELNLAQNRCVQRLVVIKNQLTQLNVRGLKLLKTVKAWDNRLQQFDARGCTGLQEAWIYNNDLEHIDLEGCCALEVLRAHRNPNQREICVKTLRSLKQLSICQTSVRLVDVSDCQNLEYIWACRECQISGQFRGQIENVGCEE